MGENVEQDVLLSLYSAMSHRMNRDRSSMQKIVTRGHTASYSDPIAFKAGDELVLSGKSDTWDGHPWLWAQGPDGKSGWIPGDSVEVGDHRALARRDYAAIELTCSTGEVLAVLEETHGWAWCRSLSGEHGWVPLRNLAPYESAL